MCYGVCVVESVLKYCYNFNVLKRNFTVAFLMFNICKKIKCFKVIVLHVENSKTKVHSITIV